MRQSAANRAVAEVAIPDDISTTESLVDLVASCDVGEDRISLRGLSSRLRLFFLFKLLFGYSLQSAISEAQGVFARLTDSRQDSGVIPTVTVSRDELEKKYSRRMTEQQEREEARRSDAQALAAGDMTIEAYELKWGAA
jgi:hypothetical protein